MIRNYLVNIIKNRFQYRSIIKFSQSKDNNKIQGGLIQKDDVRLMQDNYQKIKMKGLQQRQITGVDDFQRQILIQNKFDLMNPKIEPKIASLSTTLGLDINSDNYLAEISLGKIKVKKQNQIFLSQVDPYNIPEYYDIVFDYEKQMSLVGKRVEQNNNDKIQQDSEMKISTRKAFEQKSKQQLMRQQFGIPINSIFNSKRLIMKHIIYNVILCIFIVQPLVQLQVQLANCVQSIKQIQQERMQQVNKLKKQAFINAIVNNPDMIIK